MKKIILFFLIFSPILLTAQRSDKKLEAQVKAALTGFNGDIGVYIKNLRTGRTVEINADSIFPTASVVKVPIMVGIADKLATQQLKYDQALTYRDSLLYAGEDILGSFKDGEKIALNKVIMLMLTTSDNTASLWLQTLAGTGTRINELMNGFGLKHTKVNSRTTGRETNRSTYGWGQTTPGEMAGLFEMIYQKQVISAAASEQMMRLLSRNFWDDVGLSQVPPTVAVFSKNGAVDASRSEVMLVNDCRNPYLLAVFTKNNKDMSWVPGNEAWVLIKKISKIAWDHYK